jgi:hypothetical protein
VNERSPVPEWFGRGEPAPPNQPTGGPPAPASAPKSAFGCVALVLSILIASGGFAFAIVQNEHARRAEARVQNAERRLAERTRELDRARRDLDEERARARAAASVPEPREAAAPSPPAESSSGDLARVLASLRPKLRACYENALAYAPEAEGRVELTLVVAPAGSVDSATATSSGNLPAPVSRCVETVAKTARFPEATEPKTVRFPVVFAK